MVKVLDFLTQYPDSYFLIGGQATSLHIIGAGLTPRKTVDFDIVLVTTANDSSFFKEIEKLLLDGKYQNKYRNEKKTAYRFENPISIEYPRIIEFFVEEGAYQESLDKRLAKTNIEINEDKISAITLNKELYNFAFRHRTIIDGLSVLDIPSLIVLKVFAYYKNKELYKQGKVSKNDYLKHRRDVYRLLSIVIDIKQIEDLPDIVVPYLNEFLNILNATKDLAKQYSVKTEIVVENYKKMFSL